jgi:anti-anti-sigma factor
MMDIQITTENDVRIVRVNGKLDALSAARYEQVLNKAIAAGAERLVVDCQGLHYVSSAGLRALLNTAKPLMAAGGQIIFAALQPPVRAVFEMTNLLAIFTVRDTVASALAEL